MGNIELSQFKQMLETVLEASDIAWWDWDILENRVVCNDLKFTMLGYTREQFQGAGYERFTDLLHPDDHERTMNAMRDHLEGRASIYQIDYRIQRADQTYTWYMDRGAIIDRSEQGKPLRLRGLVIDLGEEIQEDAKDRRLFETIRKALPKPDDPDAIVEICVVCKKLRIERQLWVHVGEKLGDLFPASVSHGLCPGCIRQLYPDMAEDILSHIR